MAKVPFNQTIPNSFSFFINEDNTTTSAGVYNSNNILIRTLWSNVIYNAGIHSQSWDGLDDNGNQQPFINYTVKVASNNSVYTWQGVIGNNSTNQTGPDVWANYGATLSDMVQIGNFMYCTMWFSEYTSGQMKFDINTPNQVNKFSNIRIGQGSYFTTANATYVFYGGQDYLDTLNFVFATLVSNDNQATFTDGVNENPALGFNYPSILDLNGLAITGKITGLAVQQAGNGYLYVSHANQNLINVYQTGDGSGLFIRSIAITNPTNIQFESDNSLWIAQGTTITKYTVNPDATLTITGNVISGFSRIAGVSILHGDLSVLDAGNQQIVKRFNSTSLAQTGIIGVLGGYSASPAVTDNKFYIEDTRGAYPVFVRHQSDGSLWISDVGNCRYQHFDSSGNYLNNIQFLPQQYCANVVYNQPTQVFSNFLEYTIDYSQSIKSCWTLINNWGYNQQPGWDSLLPISAIVLMSNGRRYALLNQVFASINYWAELISTGMRLINTQLPAEPEVDSLGNLYTRSAAGNYPNQILGFNKYTLTGFDGSNNPIYSSPVQIASIPLGSQIAGGGYSDWSVTANNNLILFNGARNLSGNTLYHLSAFNLTNNNIAWATLPDDFLAYTGNFPQTATFEQGNNVNQPSNQMAVVGTNIFTSYKGEGWNNGETGVFEHFTEDGLLIGIAGPLSIQVLKLANEAPFAMAGNTLSMKPVQIGDDIYIWLNDEKVHSGLHLWKISNLASINTQSINLALTNRTLPITPTKIDLLFGLPEDQSIQGSHGWSQFPAQDFFNNGNDRFSTITRRAKYNLNESPDVVVDAGGQASGLIYYLQRDLMSNINLSNWTISGTLDLRRLSFNSQKSLAGAIFDINILDTNNKVLANITPYSDITLSFNGVNFTFPTTSFIGSTGYGSSPFIIRKNGSNIYLLIFLFGEWISSNQPIADGTANILNPKYLQIGFQFISAVPMNAQFGIIDLFFEGN